MADIDCEFGKYLFEDLLKSTEGDFRCVGQGIRYDADCNPTDFPVCKMG